MLLKNLITCVLAVLLLLTVCTCMAACQRTDVVGQPITAVSAPEDVGVFDNDDLFNIMDEAEKLLLEGSYVIENPSEYVQYFFKSNRQILVNCFDEKEDAIVISYSEDKSDRKIALKYGIFLHLICSRYPDAVCKEDYNYVPYKTNRTFSAYVFFYPAYKEDGFETPLDACKFIADALENSKDNAFYLHMGDFFMIFEGRLDYGTVIYDYDFDGYEKYLDNIG